MQTPAEIAALHLATYAATPTLYAAPGRVNLIGEHTDYCDGFVMPAAIDFSTLIAISPRNDGRILAHSVNFDESIDRTLADQLDNRLAQRLAGSKTHWSDYPAGVLWALREAGVDISSGFSFTIAGDVPLGAGLSSSASVEVATAFAVLGALGIPITSPESATLPGKQLNDPNVVPPANGASTPADSQTVAHPTAPTSMPLRQVALLCQRAENHFVGANVGIMDQFVICCGEQDNAVMIDCRSLDYQLAPIPTSVRIVICNSMVKHSVAGGEYNTRRAEIEQGTAILRSHRPEIKALRDATVEDLAQWGDEMPPNVLRRCRHVITEDNRVLAAVQAFKDHDLTRFGELMHEAHVSFRDDFEASCPEIDILVDLAVKQPGCFGARLTGGGFGGCTVNLVAVDQVDAFTEAMRDGYLAATSILAEIYTSRASAGAHSVTPAG
jgi:galactokinase